MYPGIEIGTYMTLWRIKHTFDLPRVNMIYDVYSTRYGLSWGKAQAAAKDRTLWKNIVVALCPTGDKEDK